MWRKPLNSVTLATTTHKDLGKVADRTSTQVRVQMINKWRMKIVQKKIYKVEDSSWKGDGKRERESNIAI